MDRRWQDEKENVHTAIFDYVSTVESAQSDIFERFLRYACLYDPHTRMGFTGGWWQGGNFMSQPTFDSQVSENVCAANVDTVAAIISRSQPSIKFQTDDGDWTTQRRARRLEWYAEGLLKLLDVHTVAQRVFKDAAIFGTGLIKVYQDGNRVRVERVLVDELVVDEGECKTAAPRQLHQRKLVNRSILRKRFPEHAEAIDRANADTSGLAGTWTWWADYRPVERDQCVVVESWQLPDGDEPGRHCICVDGATILDEDWDREYFPFARMVWSEPTTGWYGVGLIARIAGHQRALNKLNWQIDRQLDQFAVPTTWVQMADAKIAVQTISRLGTIGVYKANKPETVTPTAVSGEQFKRLADIKSSSFEESGVSRLAASSMKPAGIESAVAMREYKDTTTERFALQEQGYERLILDIVWLILAACKELGDAAPTVVRKSRFNNRKIRWRDVDLDEVRVSMAAANSLARSPAGRKQTVIELSQAGLITQDEARRLLQHPDLEAAMTLYTAALDDIERCIEEIEEGEFLVPEPFQNLKMGIWRMQQAYHRDQGDGAPQSVLEALRTWTVTAAQILNPPAPPAAPPMMGPGGPMGPAPGPEGAFVEPPMGPPAQSALAPTAMNLAATRQQPAA